MGRRDNQLARAGSTAISKTAEQLCDSSILTCVTMTAQMLKTELTTQEQAMWVQLLRPYPLPLIQKSFHQFLKTGIFFPKPAEIIGLIESYQKIERERVATEERKAERARVEAARATGEVWGWGDVLRSFRDVMTDAARKALHSGKKMPSVPVAAQDGDTVIVITPEKRRRAHEQAMEAQKRFGGAK